jgi:hypothetical protein
VSAGGRFLPHETIGFLIGATSGDAPVVEWSGTADSRIQESHIAETEYHLGVTGDRVGIVPIPMGEGSVEGVGIGEIASHQIHHRRMGRTIIDHHGLGGGALHHGNMASVRKYPLTKKAGRRCVAESGFARADDHRLHVFLTKPAERNFHIDRDTGDFCGVRRCFDLRQGSRLTISDEKRECSSDEDNALQ